MLSCALPGGRISGYHFPSVPFGHLLECCRPNKIACPKWRDSDARKLWTNLKSQLRSAGVVTSHKLIQFMITIPRLPDYLKDEAAIPVVETCRIDYAVC